jgi:Undecaprenyl-phosphate galactose phosphotransferase WbaP
MAFSAYLIGEGNRLSRIVFILSLFFCLIIVPLLRFIIYNRFSKNKSWGLNVAVIASHDEFVNITTRLQKIRRLGFHPEIILCTDGLADEEKAFHGIPVYGYSSQMCQKIRSAGINFAFYSSKNLSEKDPILIEISTLFPTVYYVLPESTLSSLWVDVTDLSGRPTLKVRYHLLESAPNLAKRVIELIVVFLILIITLPLSLLTALLIFLEDGEPVFYKQDRLGVNGKPFTLLKFRTMVADGDSILENYLSNTPAARFEHEEFHKLEKDPRITRVGSFLRKYSIDELPQLLNIIRGEMNLIGPRAYMVHELDVNDELTKTILRIRPGVTGWWQVMGRNEATFHDRQKMDLYYITNWSLWMDYYILIKTFWIVTSGQGK